MATARSKGALLAGLILAEGCGQDVVAPTTGLEDTTVQSAAEGIALVQAAALMVTGNLVVNGSFEDPAAAWYPGWSTYYGGGRVLPSLPWRPDRRE